MNKMFKGICFGLTPLIISSIVTPISSCVNMKNNQNQSNQKQEIKITYDELCYMRQNALVNFSRLSKDKQKEINFLIFDKKEEMLGDDNKTLKVDNAFIYFVEKYFNDSSLDFKERHEKICSLCNGYGLSVFDYLGYEKQQKNNSDVKVENKLNDIILFCKNNYYSSNTLTSKIKEFELQNYKNKTYLYSLSYVNSLMLKDLLSDVFINNNKNDKFYENKSKINVFSKDLITIDRLYDRGQLRVGSNVTDYFLNQSLSIDESNKNEKFKLQDFENSSLRNDYDFEAKITNFSYDIKNGYWIDVDFGVINKKYKID